MEGVVKVDIDELWARMERSADALAATKAAGATAVAKEAIDPAVKKAKAKQRRRWRRWLDALATVTWAYVILKLFVFDVDARALDAVNPGLAGVLRYRFLFVLLAVAAFAWFARWKAVASLLYIAGFPFIILFWKVPFWIQRQRSWLVVVAAVHVLSNLFTEWRKRVTYSSLALLAALVILLFSAPLALCLAMVIVAVWFAWSVVRLFRVSLFGPSFLVQQHRLIESAMKREYLAGLAEPPTDLLELDDVQEYTQEQVTQFTGKVSASIGVNRALYFWAYQLQRYRQTPASIAFAALDYASLFVRAVAAFALLNWALYKVDPGQYVVTGEPGLIQMAVYAMSRLAFSDGGGITAIGDAASLLALANGAVGFVVLAAVGLSILLSLRPDRESASAARAVAELKQRARSQELAMKNNYNVDVDEGIARLARLGQDIASLADWMTRSIPTDFFDDAPDTPDDASFS